MALTKIINDGDELVFDISQVAHGARKQISVILVRRARPANILVIRADRSIPISHIRQQVVGQDDNETAQLPTYQHFSQVQAAKITAIKESGPEDVSIMFCPKYLLFLEGVDKPVEVDDAWVNHFKPETGGYYVQYEGITLFNKAKEFESAYSRI